jgi:DNA repair protein RadD
LELWNYQREVIARLDACIEAGKRCPLITMATGSGKTVIIAAVINNWVKRGKRVGFLAHRKELITQASSRLSAAGVRDHAILKAGFPMRLMAPVQVGSVQTIHARAFRSKKIELGNFDLIVIDEAHHSRARTYQQIIDAYPNAIIVGLSATPCRGDGLGLGNIFDCLVEGPSVEWLIREKHLVGTKVYAPYRPDLRGIRVDRKKADYDETQLASAMDRQQLVGDIVTHWLKHADHRLTVCFATGVQHSTHIRNEFRNAGVAAEHLDGKTPQDERDEILKRLSAGDIQVVSNCMVLTEGWDQPQVSCLILARPTRQLGLFRQMIGRVLRPHPGKDHALIIDHSGATFEHGFAEDQIYWPLESDDVAVNQTHAARKEEHHQGLTTCPECSAVRMEGDPCHSCGWKPKSKPRFVAFADGDLAHIQRDRSQSAEGWTTDGQVSFYQQLRSIEAQRQYKRGWAANKYREKFGSFPPWSWNNAEPKAPSGAVLAWVRSRNIAYAKAMQGRV